MVFIRSFFEFCEKYHNNNVREQFKTKSRKEKIKNPNYLQ